MKNISKKQHLLIGISTIITFIIVVSIILFSNKNKPEYKKKLGEIKVENQTEQSNKNEETYTEVDGYGNNYKKVGLVNEGIMFDLPGGFTGKRIKDVYYIYPNDKDDKNFSLLYAFRFYKNDNWEKRSPEYAKDKLMDSTKASIKYVNSEFSKPLNLFHLNRGTAKKMGEELIYEEANTSRFSNPDDPAKILDLFTSFTYIPLANTNVELTAISPIDNKQYLNEIQESIVSSISEYSIESYKNTKSLDKVYDEKYFKTKLSSKYHDANVVSGALLSTVSDDILSRDYNMFITIGTLKNNEKIDITTTNSKLVEYVYYSWFNFSSVSAKTTVLDVSASKPVVNKNLKNNMAYFHEFKLIGQNDPGTSVNDVLNPARVVMYTVKLKDDRIGYIAIRHSEYNADIAKNIIRDIALNTTFK